MTNTAEASTTNETANAEQSAPVAPEKDSSKSAASKNKGGSKGLKDDKRATKPTTPFDGPDPTVSAKTTKATAKPRATKKATPTKKAPKREPKAKVASERSNKKAEVITMMMRVKGATLAEIMEATNWQPHTVRGFVSLLASKGGETVESSKNTAGERTYRIAK